MSRLIFTGYFQDFAWDLSIMHPNLSAWHSLDKLRFQKELSALKYHAKQESFLKDAVKIQTAHNFVTMLWKQ